VIGLLHPEYLLLLLPGLLIWWRTGERTRPTQLIRVLLLLLVVGALTMPYLRRGVEGRDLVVVVDRSRSMPAEASLSAREVIGLAEEERRRGDRVAVVTFGADAAIETLPDEQHRFRDFERLIDPDGSNLGEAIEAALNLIPPERHGSILVISDGEENGRDAETAARRAFARGVPIDVRPFPRPAVTDLSVEHLDLPAEIAVGEPFQFTAWVHADRRSACEFTLRRGGTIISSGQRVFEPGRNRLLFRDLLETSGITDYTVDLLLEGDRIPENNRGRGAVRAMGIRPVLVLNEDGDPDTLVHALRVSGIPVESAAPEDLRLSPLTLSRWRAVIVENVAASRIGSDGLAALREFVRERGGGLLLCGGQASFGVGGYHLTAIDEILPVSMELRQEHRKQGVAMVIVLDRSGSMALEVVPGSSKMDLANRGAVAAIELLSAIDSVGIIAVDSSPHVIQELVAVEDRVGLEERARSIGAGGGGIYVHTGLVAAARMLAPATQINRHIILFADAADAEEQGGVPALVGELTEIGTTISVIALGAESDPDAEFLKRVAREGGGEIYFSTDPGELPKMFAQDTMTVARSTFIEEETEVELLPDLFGLGEISAEGFPTIRGYNLNYLRDGATPGAATLDEFHAPILAFWQQGLGRSAAFCAQIGGSFGAEVVAWPHFSELFVTLARWLTGTEEAGALFATMRREGATAVVSVEIDREAPAPPDTSHLIARLRSPGGEWSDHLLERIDETRYEARIPLREEGIVIGTVRLDDERFVTLPPIALPYSPEFERRPDPAEGERLLRRLARDSGGRVAPAAHTLFRGDREAKAHRIISRELLLAALLLFLLEIAGRRLGLWSKVGIPRGLGELARGLRRSLIHRRPPAAPLEMEADTSSPPEGAPRSRPPEKPTGSITSALDAAREKAERRMKR
jgi:Mg-chelatase subunit ChlD